ncbi:hypothetical protein ACH4PR_04400 [Streptomyces mirabilis]|uniref:hypothetical protein n=1 Tax=Streptomyces mirabilis TaxID=68239 RepID=UPI0037B3E314
MPPVCVVLPYISSSPPASVMPSGAACQAGRSSAFSVVAEPSSAGVTRYTCQSTLDGPAVARAPPSGVATKEPLELASSVRAVLSVSETAVSSGVAPPGRNIALPVRSWSPTTACASPRKDAVMVLGAVPGAESTRIALVPLTSQRSLKTIRGELPTPVRYVRKVPSARSTSPTSVEPSRV